MLIRPGSRVLPELLSSALASSVVKSQYMHRLSGSTVAHVNVRDVVKLQIPIPPYDEQVILVRQLNRVLEAMRGRETAVRVMGDTVKSLNESILAKAFRGELVPQDPTDEPASVLLDRIRAERSASTPTTSPRRKQPRASAPAPTPARVAKPSPPPPPKPAPPKAPAEASDEAEQTMSLIRATMRGRGSVSREALVHAIAEGLGYQRVSANVRERIDGHLLAAVRRYVIEGGGGDELRLATTRIDDYHRDALVAMLGAVTSRGCIYERDQLARMVLNHLGFRRLTSAATMAIKSATNAAIRRSLFERVDAKQLRRLAPTR
jgi:predicted component of type VI protein secretion system